MMGKATLAAKLTPPQTTIRRFSDRLVEAQRPIRVLDAIKWDDTIEKAFFAAGCRQQPPVTRDYYGRRPLPFDPESKRQELLAIEDDVCHQLGDNHAAGRILTRMCQEYREVVDLLVQRGTPRFNILSENLYGSALPEELRPRRPGQLDAPRSARSGSAVTEATWHGSGACEERARRARKRVRSCCANSSTLADYFADGAAIRVRLSDGIVADAAAGCDYIKIRREARFTPREVRLLEVHEGWVHLGTTLNGLNQPICTFLGKGPPSSALTQEGLAVLTELFTAASHPDRVRRLTNRVAAVGNSRASTPTSTCFCFSATEQHAEGELSAYDARLSRQPAGRVRTVHERCELLQGLHADLTASFARRRVGARRKSAAALLFCGKTNPDDLETLAELVEEGLVVPPRYVPAYFADLDALTV